MKKNKKILICFNEPIGMYDNYTGKEIEDPLKSIDLSESGFMEHLDTITKSLKKNFTTVETCSVNSNIKKFIKKVNKYSPSVIYNFVESIDGKANLESDIAGVYELLGYPYTGNPAIALGNCLNKSRTKHILNSAGIKTPNSIFLGLEERINGQLSNLRFPLIVKLLAEDASIGISEHSVVHNLKGLNKQLDFLFTNYKQGVVVEEYIDGREFNLSILGNEVLPISEIVFDGLPKNLPNIVTYEAKWDPETQYFKFTKPICPARIDIKLAKKLIQIALKSFNSLKCRDYARVDIRIDSQDNPFVIDVNPNPDISIDSGFVRSAKKAGYSYPKLLKQIAHFALDRAENDT